MVKIAGVFANIGSNRIWIFLTFAIFFNSALAISSDQPKILSKTGSGTAFIEAPNGKYVIENGLVLNPGDRIVTGPTMSVKIEFPDGSIVMVGRNSQFEIQSQKSTGMTINTLQSGSIRSVIKKVSNERKKVHFLIQTKAAVIGVRGTDFVVDVDPEKTTTDLHTLEGSVDLAKSSDDLTFGRGVLVSENQTSFVDSKSIREVKAFNRSEYESRLKNREPELWASVRDGQLSSKEPSLQILRFRLASVYKKQSSGGSTFTGTLGVHPHLDVFWIFGLGFQADFTPIKSRSSGKTIVDLRFGPSISISLFGPIGIEGIVGYETWASVGHGVFYDGSIHYKFKYPLFIDRLYLGGAYYSQNVGVISTTTTIQAGLGIRI